MYVHSWKSHLVVFIQKKELVTLALYLLGVGPFIKWISLKLNNTLLQEVINNRIHQLVWHSSPSQLGTCLAKRESSTTIWIAASPNCIQIWRMWISAFHQVRVHVPGVIIKLKTKCWMLCISLYEDPRASGNIMELSE